MQGLLVALAALLLGLWLGVAEGAVGWVGNMSPPGSQLRKYEQFDNVVITLEVYRGGFTEVDGPAVGLECNITTGKVTTFGGAWTNIRDLSLAYQSRSNANHVYSLSLSTFTLGLHEFTAYCYDGGEKVYQQAGNARLEIVPEGTLGYALSTPAQTAYTGGKFLLYWEVPASFSPQDLIAVRAFPQNNSNPCPAEGAQYRHEIGATTSYSGHALLSVPPVVGTLTVTQYASEFNDTNPNTFLCNGAYLRPIHSISFQVFDGTAPIPGDGGQALFFDYSAAFPDELALKKEFLKADFPLVAADKASYDVDFCSPQMAYSFQDFTIETWFKSVSYVGCCSTILYLDGNIHMQVVDGGQLSLRLLNSNPAKIHTTSIPQVNLLDNQWHHLAVTYNMGLVKMYIDGTLVHEQNYGHTDTFRGKNILLGSSRDSIIDKHNKWMDEFRLWSVVRTAQEINQAMYRALLPSERLSMVAYYDFDQDQGQGDLVLRDRSSSGLDLKLGFEEIGSAGPQTFKRKAPKFVPSTAPLNLSPFYVRLLQPYQASATVQKTVRLPHSGESVDSFLITSLPHPSISLKTTANVAITSTPHQLPGGELIISTANPNASPLETSFTYTVTKDSKPSSTGTVRITLENLPTSVPGGPGSALKCDGTQFGYAKNFELGVDENTGRTHAYTVEFWSWSFYSSVSERKGAVYSFDSSEVEGRWCVPNNTYSPPHCKGRFTALVGDPVFDVYNGWAEDGRGSAANDFGSLWGEWNHIAITSEGLGGKLKIFLNGNEVANNNDYGSTTPLHGLSVCHWAYYGPQVHSYVGLLDEFRIWDYSRSWEEIVRDMNFELKGSEPGLMVYYNFNDDSDPTVAKDLSGKGRHLLFGGCTPCPSGSCNANLAPMVPCYEPQVADERRRPTYVKSSAPVGGHFPPRTFEPTQQVPMSLTSIVTSREGEVAGQLTYILVAPPAVGRLLDLSNSSLVVGTNDPLPQEFTFEPEEEGGGNPYATFTFTVRDSLGVSTHNVTEAIYILCAPGTYTDNVAKLCRPCAPGTFTNNHSHVEQCEICPEGYSQPLKGATTCSPCAPNTFQDGSSPQRCQACSLVDYSYPTCVRPPENMTASLSAPASIALVVIAVILMVLCALVSLVFIFYQETPVVKSASAIFCLMILLGLIVACSGVFFFVSTPTRGICIARPWIVAIALALTLGNLFIKTWRIHRIFGQTKFSGRMKLIDDRSLLTFSGLALLVECLIPAIWTAVDPLVPRQFTATDIVYLECASESPGFSWAMVGVFIGLNAVILFYGAYLAFKTRKVSSAFRESKYIAICIYNILLATVLILPLVYIQAVGFYTSFFLRSIGILFCSAFTLAALFGPKLYIIFFQKEKNTPAYYRTFKSGEGKKLSSFSTPESATSSDPEREVLHGDRAISMAVLVQNDTGVFGELFGSKFTPYNCHLFLDRKCLAWEAPNPRNSGFRNIKKATVSGVEATDLYEIEILFDTNGSLKFRFQNKEEFDTWSNGFKSVCKYRVLHQRSSPGQSRKDASTTGTKAGQQTNKALVESASHLAIELQEA